MLEFPIPRAHLRACMITAGQTDIRYYLNGLLFEVYADRAFVVGTDGHRLTVCRVLFDAPPLNLPEGGITFIVPGALCKVKRDKKAPALVSFDPATGIVGIATDGKATSAHAIDGKFPDWRAVMPRKVSGAASHYRAKYIGDLDKVAAEVGSDTYSPTLHQNGTSGALVTYAGAPDCITVVMPMRESLPPPNVEAFLQVTGVKAKKAEAVPA